MKEANASHTECEVDLQNKPEWCVLRALLEGSCCLGPSAAGLNTLMPYPGSSPTILLPHLSRFQNPQFLYLLLTSSWLQTCTQMTQFSEADAVIAPILQCFTTMLKNGEDSYKAEEGKPLSKR
jgi:hypothetical protein